VEVVTEFVKETIMLQWNEMFDIWTGKPIAKNKLAEV